MILLLVFCFCIYKIWRFFKNHRNMRANEKSMAVKAFIAILSLCIRGVVIYEEVIINRPEPSGV